MVSRNSIYPFPCDGVLSSLINNHDHVSRYKSYYQKGKLGWIDENILRQPYAYPKHPRFSNYAKQDFLLSDIRIGALEPLLFIAIIHGLLLH